MRASDNSGNLELRIYPGKTAWVYVNSVWNCLEHRGKIIFSVSEVWYLNQRSAEQRNVGSLQSGNTDCRAPREFLRVSSRVQTSIASLLVAQICFRFPCVTETVPWEIRGFSYFCGSTVSLRAGSPKVLWKLSFYFLEFLSYSSPWNVYTMCRFLRTQMRLIYYV